MLKLTILLVAISALIACQKQVEVDLPPVEQSYVVEGKIENDQPPMVMLTKTQGYFDPTDGESIMSTFVHGAEVKITVDGITFILDEICTSEIPDSLLEDVSALTGIPEDYLRYLDYCLYSTLNPDAFGKEGKTYDLNIHINGKEISASTYIPNIIPLDTSWFEPVGNLDSLGFMWARLSDPPEEGNAYRWLAQRINHYTYGPQKGEIKDAFPIAPLGSAFDDKFLNGLSFDFQYNRGEVGQIEYQDDEGPEEGYFKSGDTVIVKFCSIPYENYLYLRSMENQAATAGSPFASPGNLAYNVKGGLGIWAGYGVFYDTVICP